ncbi:TetR/AcrR family transcriptional regulator [Lacisediminihabitans sp. H27-G8]|uniref:TetR/AcrR family transcriptional regulator n=1 Tax=Lacisediminihabitans sp. H27-G8 TaxID=3111909 RepID=UPI0038FC86B7
MRANDHGAGIRNQVVQAAYAMFARRGIHAVSMAEIEDGAGLSAEVVGEWFSSRDEVGAAFLQRREVEWFYGVVEAGIKQRGVSPEDRLLAIFDVFDEWFQRDDYEACTFITVMLEADPDHPLGLARLGHLSRIRDIIAAFANEARLDDLDNFCLSWHILMKGAVISAVDGDTRAAARAKTMARALIAHHRPGLAFAEDNSFQEAASWLEAGF